MRSDHDTTGTETSNDAAVPSVGVVRSTGCRRRRRRRGPTHIRVGLAAVALGLLSLLSVGCERVFDEPSQPYGADDLELRDTCASCRSPDGATEVEDASTSSGTADGRGSSGDTDVPRDGRSFDTRDGAHAPKDGGELDAVETGTNEDAADDVGDVRGSDGGCGAGTDGTSKAASPLLIYVARENDTLSYLDCARRSRQTSVSGDIRALGPSLHWDDDGIREIPYVVDDGENAPALRIVDAAGDASPTRLDRNVMGDKKFGRLAVADVDDDGQLGIVYPDDDRGLGYVEPGTAPYDIVRRTVEGLEAKPYAVMGAIASDDRGGERIYWIDLDEEVRFVSQARPMSIRTFGSSFDVGIDRNVGVGPARDLNGDGTSRWAVVNGSNNPGTIAASGGGQFQPLNRSQRAAKVPPTFADLQGTPREELVFALQNGWLYYVETADLDKPGPRKIVRAGQNPPRIRIRLGPGLAPGTAHVPGRRHP